MASPGGKEVGRVSVRVVPDTSRFLRELKAQLKKIERQAKVQIPVKLNTKKALAEAKALKAALDDDLLARFKAFGSGAGGSLREVGKEAKLAGRKFLGLTRVGWIVVAVFTLAAPLISLVASLLAGLPFLLSAGGAAAAAIALGLDGIKDAAKELQPEIKTLRKELSETFRAELTPLFKQLKPLLQALGEPLAGVAFGLSKMAKGLVDAVTSARGMDQLDTILTGIRDLFVSLEPFVRDFTEGFLNLAEAGAKEFGTLSDLLNTFAADFNAMTRRVSADGSFGAAMTGLSQVMGSLLHLFNRLLESGIEWMGVMGGPLASFVNAFGDVVIALMPVLTALSNLVANVLAAAFTALTPVIQALTPSFSLLAGLLGELLIGAIQAVAPLLETLAQIFNEVLLQALLAISPFIPPLVDFLGQLATMVGSFLTDAMTELTPLLLEAAVFFREILKALLPLLPPLLDLAQTVLTELLDAIVELLPILLPIAEQVFPALVEATKTLVPILLQLIPAFAGLIKAVLPIATAILSLLAPAFKLLVVVVKLVWPIIKGVIEGATKVILGIINVFTGILTGNWSQVWEGIKQILSGAWQFIINAIQLFIFGRIAGLLFRAVGFIGGFFVRIGARVIGAVSGFLGRVIGFFAGLGGRVLSALGNFGLLLINAGRSLINGLISGIRSAAGRVISEVKRLASKVRSYFPFSPAKRGPFSGKGYTSWSGRSLVTDWARGIEEATPKAIRAIENMMDMSSKTANAQWQGHISADDFGSVADRVGEALAGWSVEIDQDGIAKLVRKSNQRRLRRA